MHRIGVVSSSSSVSHRTFPQLSQKAACRTTVSGGISSKGSTTAILPESVRGPRVPRPSRAAQDLVFAREKLIPRIEKNLRWARNLRYHRLQIQETERVSTSGVSDPTGQVATGVAQKRVKEAIRTAEINVEKALRALEAADRDLDSAFRQADPTYARLDNRLHPPLVTAGELEDARASQARREARGEGFGES